MKGDASEKKLACQFIPRFFKDFPKLAEQAIDAQLDLCEDEDAVVSCNTSIIIVHFYFSDSFMKVGWCSCVNI